MFDLVLKVVLGRLCWGFSAPVYIYMYTGAFLGPGGFQKFFIFYFFIFCVWFYFLFFYFLFFGLVSVLWHVFYVFIFYFSGELLLVGLSFECGGYFFSCGGCFCWGF